MKKEKIVLFVEGVDVIVIESEVKADKIRWVKGQKYFKFGVYTNIGL